MEDFVSSTMKILKKIIILIVLVICYVLANAGSIYIYSFKDEARSADVAIVLGASTYNGHASPVYQKRINHAVVLYNKHLVKKIITTGGYGKGNPVSDAYNAKLYAISQGVPEDDILTED
ncbi:YdcF family protein, partial [uncultured Catenibacterium sp.]|uniref:YdcF family protein n=1 Tax=uncultured Catenibacterium sp. TaxID=286142 RepID=UPI0025CF610E